MAHSEIAAFRHIEYCTHYGYNIIVEPMNGRKGMALLMGRTRFAILSLLYLNEDKQYYFRQIVRELGLGQGAIQRELAKLTEEGFLNRSRSGNRVYYQASRHSPDFKELQAVLSRSSGTGREPSRGPGRKHDLVGSERISEICVRYHVSRLAIFGSSIRGEDTVGSDLDLLVEFEPGHTPGLEFFTLEEELTEVLGRKVDLNTPAFLSHYFREDVLKEAREIYAA